MRNFLKLFTFLTFFALISACQKPLSSWEDPVAEPLPYRFSIASLVDAREKKQPYENFNVFPFSRDLFTQQMVRELPYSMFTTYPAKLIVELQDYATTQYNGSYALSYSVALRAEDDYGRTIADKKTYICSETTNISFTAHKLLESAYKGESLSNETQHANIFKDLMHKCITQTVSEFKANLYNAAYDGNK